MKLTLKPEFKHTRVSRGNFTFDSDINNEGEYEYFYNNGFSDLFDKEEIETPKEKIVDVKKFQSKLYKGIKNDDKK